VDQLAQLENFENLLELNETLLPKENCTLMDCSKSVQIYKNYGDQQVFFFKGANRANQLSLHWKIFQDLG
jgi:hypothetical protein